MIDVWGADHGGYVKRMKAAVKAVSGGTADLDVKIVQLVKLMRAGVEVKMSKRSGEFVTLREVVDEVGRDAVRFMMLYRKNDAVLDFDLAKVIEQSTRQPGVLRPVRPCPRPFGVPQCRRGAARSAGGRRRAHSLFVAGAARAARRPGGTCADAQARALPAARRSPPRWPTSRTGWRSISMNWRANFTRNGRAGPDAPHLRFIIQDDPQLTVARLALVQGFVTVLASGLALLGVEAPNEMR